MAVVTLPESLRNLRECTHSPRLFADIKQPRFPICPLLKQVLCQDGPHCGKIIEIPFKTKRYKRTVVTAGRQDMSSRCRCLRTAVCRRLPKSLIGNDVTSVSERRQDRHVFTPPKFFFASNPRGGFIANARSHRDERFSQTELFISYERGTLVSRLPVLSLLGKNRGEVPDKTETTGKVSSFRDITSPVFVSYTAVGKP